MAEDDLANTIADNAVAPKTIDADGVRVDEHPLPDQIAADKYLRAKTVAHRNPVLGFTRVKIVPPGSV